MNTPNLKALLLPWLVVVSACTSTGGDIRIKEESPIFESVSSETSKLDLFHSLGMPWDVIFDDQSDMTGWLFLYLEKVVSNPLTYVPYLGLVAGGGEVTVYTRFYCFDRGGSLSGRAMLSQEMYKSIFSEYSAMIDGDARRAREGRIRSELEHIELLFDPEQHSSMEWHLFLRDEQIPGFKRRLFDECKENKLHKLVGFEGFL